MAIPKNFISFATEFIFLFSIFLAAELNADQKVRNEHGQKE